MAQQPSNFSNLNILDVVSNDRGVAALFIHLNRFLSTDNQRRNLNLVVHPAYESLRDFLR